MKEPSMLVRVHGMAPLDATVWECERLRCNACGEVFTAPTPEGVGTQKYDESADAMVAMLRYGAGVPSTGLRSCRTAWASRYRPRRSGAGWSVEQRA
jgi:hypothetical protein